MEITLENIPVDVMMFPSFFVSRHRDCVKHIAINRGPNRGFGFAANCSTHVTLEDLVRHYNTTSLQIHNSELDTTLMYPVGDDN